MRHLTRAILAIGIATLSLPANAQKLPPLKLTDRNAVPDCATPGRMMAFLGERNQRLRPRFKDVAVHYMRHGEELGVRWDYAFFQMMLETNSLKFTGDVDWDQNNFAGLGATGGGVKGERFATVSDGVRAHLQHLMIYAGIRVEDPVADRTRKVQSWGILDRWRSAIRGPITFSHIGRKWAPGDRGYGRDIEAIGELFYGGHCKGPDPDPQLLAAARGTAKPAPDLAPKTVATTRRDLEPDRRSALGATEVKPRPQLSASPPLEGNVTILNKNATEPEKPAADKPAAAPDKPAATPGQYQVASAAGAAAKFAAPSVRPVPKPPAVAIPDKKPTTNNDVAKAAPPKKHVAKSAPPAPTCKVWTASYGGQKVIIIKSKSDTTVNYTVLDVNEGREKRETAAYIAAYAKGGEEIGAFKSQTQALEKAFKLCPSG